MTKVEKIQSKLRKKNAELRKELKKLVLDNYLFKCGWSPVEVEELHKSIAVNFWCGIGYSKAVSKARGLTVEEKAMIWSLIHRYSF